MGGTSPYVFDFGPLGSSGTEGGAYNREHTFPQSWFGGDVMPMYSDLWNLYPTDSKVNNERGNDPYAEVGTASWISLNGSRSGTSSSPGYSGSAFEPIDAYKGDLVRSQFYMAARYLFEDASWPGGGATNKSQLKPWAADQYLDWSLADPVSAPASGSSAPARRSAGPPKPKISASGRRRCSSAASAPA